MYATNGTDVHLARIQLRPLDPASDAPVRSVTTAVPPPARAGAAPEHRLRGRRGERETLDRLVASVRAGNSRTLVVRGEAGAGKTALLEYLLQHAWGCRVAQAAGVETEMDLPFAGLHQLCAPFLDRLERLPEPQRDALGTAFSLRGGDAPDRFAVGLAVLGLLAEVAGERPLVCVVDDAQWLDRASAQALAFVARHLAVGPVAVVIAVRSGGAEQDLAGPTELMVRGLADGDARALLDAAVTGPLDERVRDRIVAETRGNPRALLEVARGLTPGDLAGGFGLPGATAPPDPAEETFGQQLALLPPATRLLLLVAAAEPIHDPVVVWRAAGQLGITAETAAPAAAAGLIESGGQIRFRHPLARSAVYRTAPPEERRRVHLALAEATDPDAEPERRAWHRAHAAPRARRSRGRRTRVLGRPDAGPRRPGGGGRLPRARRRADPGRPAGLPGRWPRRGLSTWPARRKRPGGCWAWPRPGPSTSSVAPARRCCAPRWQPTPPGATARPRCSRRGQAPRTAACRAGPRDLPRRVRRGDDRRPPGALRRNAGGERGRAGGAADVGMAPICCWTGWRC